MGLREENKERVRKAILKNALKFFAQKGIVHTTVHDIVDAIGIARGTFYNYYHDIDDVFDAVVHDMNLEIKAVLMESRKKADSLYDYLYLSFKGYFDFISTPTIKKFHLNNTAHVRKSTYENPILLSLIKDLNRDLRESKQTTFLTEKHEYLLLSIMFVGSPPELFLATQQSSTEFSNEQLATFLTKTFYKLLQPS
ncbi:MAG: TetR/AcrR family transcriptional regulator [Flavobacteriaceae bacterium]|jgi:AcrR family transcriptional regulator